MSHDVNDVQLVEGEATSHDVGESVNCNLDPSFAMADVVCIYMYILRVQPSCDCDWVCDRKMCF